MLDNTKNLLQTQASEGETEGKASAQDPKQQLLAELGVPLKTLVQNYVQLDVDREKVYQYAEARKAELYWRGQQFVYPIMSGGQIADWNPISGTPLYNLSEEDRESQYDYVLNVIRGDGKKFIAVLGQRGPNAKAQPRRPDDDASIERARLADSAASYLRSTWDVERIQRHLAMSLWKNGTTFAYTPWITDGEQYGVIDEPEVDWITNADGSYAPKIVGTKHYPKGCVELHLATIFEVTTPFYAKGLRETPWLWYEYEEYEGKLLRAYPQLRGKLGVDDNATGEETAVSSQGRLARDIASSPTGTYIAPRKNRWLFSRYWLRPAMYELVADKATRERLNKEFPLGIRVTCVNGELVDLTPERLDDVWAVCKPDTSEYMYADAICKDFMGIQDAINDMYNMIIETLERAIPYMLADPLVLDVLQLNKQRGKPGQIIPAKAGIGSRLSEAIVKGPQADIDPTVIKWIDTIHATGRENAGVLPAIFGGDTPAGTAREAELRRNQALQQLNTVWNEMRSFWACIYTNGVKQIARYSLVGGENLGDYEGNETDFSKLLAGGWFFTTEEAMPLTWGQKRDLIFFMLQAGPEAWKLFGLEHPLNTAKVQEILGMPGWKVPMVDAREKVLAQIKILLQGQPIQQPGGPPQPSIPPDVFEDDHLYTASVIKEWAQGAEALAIRETNPTGYANVIAFGTAHLQLGGPNANGGPPPVPSPNGGPPPSQGPQGPGVPVAPDLPGGAGPGMSQPPPSGASIGGPPQSPNPGTVAPPQ